MIAAEIILDKRYKTKNGYPVKIRVYDSLLLKTKEKAKHQYVKLDLFQNREELYLTSDLKRRSLQLEEELKFCNGGAI